MSDAQDTRNTSCSVKIAPKGTTAVKCLNDRLQITVLEKQFTRRVRPKTENTA